MWPGEKAKERGESGWEPFTLFSDQRTEFRLEAGERENTIGIKNRRESRKSDRRTQTQWREEGSREHRCMLGTLQVVACIRFS